MNLTTKPFRLFLVLLSLCLAVAACSSNSPTEPGGNPPPPVGGGGSGQFSIVITADPPELPVGGNEAATIRVTVRRTDNGQVPPNGTSIVVTTNLGSFTTLGSGLQQVVGSLLNGEVQLLLFPGNEGGSALIRAQLEGSVGQLNLPIQGSSAFFLSFVQPNAGSPSGGDHVTIRGGGFVEPVRVTFDGQVAQVLSVSTAEIEVVTPASTTAVPTNSTRSVPVTVTIRLNQTGQSTDSLAGGFTYSPGGGNIQQPLVFSVSPRTGTNDGGTAVTIVGEGFQNPVQVLFGQGTTPDTFQGVEASVQSVSANQIVAITPPARAFGQDNLNQTVSVLVRNLGSGFATISSSAFQYGTQVRITSVGPGQASSSGGDLVTIFGQGFDEPVAASLAGIGQIVLSVTGTEVLVRTVPVDIEDCNDIVGPIGVTNIESGDGDTTQGRLDFIFRAPQPVIAGVQPNSGGEVGNTQVTITGVNFVQPLRVLFGDQAATLNSVSSDGSTIIVRTPPFSGPFNTQACDDNNDGTVGERFVNTAVNVQVINLGTGCFDEFTGGFTYRPADLSCRGDQAPAPPVLPQCQDSIDNDGDGFIDFGSDPECVSPDDNNEAA